MGQMKKVFEKVFISKAFVRKTTHLVRVRIFKNKKSRNKRCGACKTGTPGKVCASKAFWGEEEQRNERTGGFSNRNKKSRRKRYETCADDVVDLKGFEPSTSRMRTERSPN